MAVINKNDKLKLKISAMTSDGRGIARTDTDFVIFVNHAIPGDLVNAVIKRKGRNFAEASITDIVEVSPYRILPECSHFGICNGCKLQNTKYEYQLELKRQNVKDAFERIGGFIDQPIPDVIGSDNTYFYRNKIEFSFSNNRWLTIEDLHANVTDKHFALGFHMPNYIDKVLDITKCYLQSDASNKILNFTRDFFKIRNETIYSTKTHTGYLRYLVIRQSSTTNEILVNLITSYENNELIREYSEFLKKEIPLVTTLVNSVSTIKAQVAQGDFSVTIFGDDYITECIDYFKFKITPGSFFQTNSLQTKKLFDYIIKLANFSKNDEVLDLYCGAGAISIFISASVDHVTGVELSDESIVNARENCELNQIKNCEFISFDVKDYLRSLINSESKRYNIFILDPPRSGLHPKAIEYINQYKPNKIIYVSCNPSTQARDVKLLSEKYNITAIQPVDMFPQTFHIENIVRLGLK